MTLTNDPKYNRLFTDARTKRRAAQQAGQDSAGGRPIIDLKGRVEGKDPTPIDSKRFDEWGALQEAARLAETELREYQQLRWSGQA